MKELMVDFITSLDGYASADGWPGLWGYWEPEYLAWLDEQPDAELLMGATTYRLMSGMAAGAHPEGSSDDFRDEDQASADSLTAVTKHVVSSTLDEPLSWANTSLIRGDAVAAIDALKQNGDGLIRTIGSLSLCRTLLTAGLVDRFRVVMFPVITGVTGAERIYDGYPDVALEMTDHRTFANKIQMVEYRPQILDGPPKGDGHGTNQRPAKT